MKGVLISAAIAALLSAGSAIAAEKKTQESGAASSAQSAEAGRGGLKEWPVSKEEANWQSAAPASSSTGESSGATGSDSKSEQ